MTTVNLRAQCDQSIFDRHAAAAHLDHLFGGYSCTVILAFGAEGIWRNGRYVFGGGFGEHYVDWPSDRNAVLTYVERALSFGRVDAYVCPYPRVDRMARRAKGNALSRRHVHADRDGTSPVGSRALAALGAWAIGSGTPGHEHIYARLQGSVDAAVHEALCRGMADWIGECDPKVSDNDVLRLAGTPNWKTDPPTMVRWLREPVPISWKPEALARVLGVSLEVAAAPAVCATAAAGPPPPVVAAGLGDLPVAVCWELHWNTGDRSVDTYRVVAACVGEGLTLDQTRAAVAARADLQARIDARSRDDVAVCWTKAMARQQAVISA